MGLDYLLGGIEQGFLPLWAHWERRVLLFPAFHAQQMASGPPGIGCSLLLPGLLSCPTVFHPWSRSELLGTLISL